ncbi:MAG: peptidoglycan-binding protein [Roseibium sp.]
MPAWKKHEAGRRGQDVYDNYDYDGTPRREQARSRIERLTRTATALGGRYDRGAPNGPESDDDLNAVADELDRLLSERSEQPTHRASRPTRSMNEPRRTPPPARHTDLDDVIGALDRLDEQVQDLGSPHGYPDDYEAAPRHNRRPGRHAIDRLSAEDDRHTSDYGDYEDEYDERYEDDDYDHRPAPRARRSSRPHRETSHHVYKDLGRRIDALRKPQEKALGHVREELGSLRDALSGLAHGTNKSTGRQNSELRRLTDMVDRLRVDKKNDKLSKDIRREISDLKSMVGRTNVEGALQTLEHGYAHILQRLDELSRASIDPRVLRGVTARLGEIEEAFAALPRSEHMVVLEDRVVAIADRMEELLQHKNHADIEPLRGELKEVRSFIEQIDIKGLVEGIDDRMKFVSGRLDDLEVLAKEQRGLDTRLSAMEDRMPEPETISRLQGRLEDIVGMMSDDRATPAGQGNLSQVDQRLNDIVDRLERMEQAGPLPSADKGAFDALENRLETIAGKIDVIEKRASRPVPVLDAAAMRSGKGTDSKFLTQLQDRLNDLTERLDEPKDTVTTSDLDKLREEIGAMRARVSEPGSTEVLEQRITDLAQVVSKGGDRADDGGLEQLGSKVAALAEQIESTSEKALSKDQFASILERIENGLQQTKSDVSDIARKAAEAAVANAPAGKGGSNDKAITSLQGDLKRLLDAAEGNEERTRNTFDGVKSVLGSITERLDSLEHSDQPNAAVGAQSSNNTPAFSPISVEERQPLFARATGMKGAEEETVAHSDGTTETGQERARDRKADFIAAARRAAQAASAEAAQLEKHESFISDESADEERGKERVGWLRNVLKRGKSSESEQNSTADNLVVDADNTEDAMSAQYAEDAKVLPGDRPAPEVASASGGRRRAILYAAAAVVLLMGTYYVTQMTGLTSPGDQKIASAPQATAEITESVVGPVEAQNVAPKAAPDTAATEAPPESSALVAQPVPSATKMSADTSAPAVAKPAPAVEQTPTAAAASAGTVTPDANLAFAPPAGVDNSFGKVPSAQPGVFSQSSAPAAGAEAATANLIASLPPEGVGPMALRSAAASGNPAAEFMVGVKYTEGNGIPADLSKAAVWYQKAAEKGLAPAQYRLASLYEKGRGVEKDLPKAKAWYTKAAEAGNAKAMHNLAVLYAEGAGGEPDYTAAAKWFESAANFGVKDSLFNLGILYAGGIGVDKNLVASYKWFAIAADQGDPEAAKRRDDVANMMDQEAMASARLAVESFKLKTPPAAANKVSMESDWADSTALPASTASIKVPDNSAMIRDAQDKLNYLGFDTGTPDGEMGPRTRSAIRAFQRSLGLSETGQVDPKLMEELKSQAI